MIVKNFTRSTIITKDLKIASSFLDRLFGLLNKNNPRSLLFNTRFGIHTFFLKKPIDILVTDKNYIVKLASAVKQNRLLFYNLKYNIVIELPENSIKISKTIVGDRIKILKN